MWYFTWILGVTMAVLLASINALMCDAQECLPEDKNVDGRPLGGD